MYVGLGISDSKNESLHNKLKTWIPKQLNFTNVVKRTLEFIKEQNTIAEEEVDMEDREYEKILNIPSLRSVRLATCSKVFHTVLKRLHKALYLNVVEIDLVGERAKSMREFNVYNSKEES